MCTFFECLNTITAKCTDEWQSKGKTLNAQPLQWGVSSGSFMLGGILLAWSGSTCPCCPHRSEWSLLCYDQTLLPWQCGNNAPNHRARGVTEYKNDANHMLWLVQSSMGDFGPPKLLVFWASSFGPMFHLSSRVHRLQNHWGTLKRSRLNVGFWSLILAVNFHRYKSQST